jgi:hypothetical protein
MSIKERNLKLDLQKAPGTKARDFILLALFQAGKNGLSAKDLEDKADVSRDTVYDECRKLKKEGLVDYKTIGKRTTYYAEPKIFNELYLNSWLFGNEIFSKISSSSAYVIADRRSIVTDTEFFPNKGFENSQYYTTEFTDKDSIERFLFEFSVKVGAIITHILLQAMNPNVIGQLTYNNKLSERTVKDYIIEAWIKNVISPVKILHSLRKSIADPGYHINLDESKKFSNTSSFQLTDKTIQKLSTAFAGLYPNLHRELEDIKKNLPKILSVMRKEVEQVRCNHNFHTSRLKNEKQFECPKCKLKIRVPLSKVETNDETIKKLNKLKPPSDTECNNHCWTRDLNYDMIHKSIVYQCPLCKEVLRFYTEDKKTLEKIQDAVQRELGFEHTVLCNNIELYFYHHRNENVTIKDLMRLYDEFRKIKIQDREDFVYDVSTILSILIKYGYVEEINASPGDPYNRVCIRTKESNLVGI